MLQNARVTTFSVSEFLRENQHRGKIIPPQPRLGLKHEKTLVFQYFQRVQKRKTSSIWVNPCMGNVSV